VTTPQTSAPPVLASLRHTGGRRREAETLVATAVVAALVGLAATQPGSLRFVIAALIAAALAAWAVRRPDLALLALVVWLAVLGTVRRVLTGISSYALGDPLLVVAAAVLATLALVACRSDALRGRTPLTHGVLVLGMWLAVTAVNPDQGGLMVGFGGVLLVVVPMLAFIVGRALVTDHLLGRVLWFYALLALPAAGYGLVQTFIALPAWDQRWVEDAGYMALNVNGVIRPFASFASASEYASFLSIGVVCWAILGTRSRGKALVVPAAGLLAVAIWFVAGRGAVVLLVASLAVVFAARLRLPIWAAASVALVAVAAIPLTAGQVAPDGFGSGAGSRLSAHQATGLAEPFGEGSTLSLHLEALTSGITSVDDRPLGAGVGSVTIASRRFAATGLNSEADPGNVALAGGVIGLVAYFVVLGFGMYAAYTRARSRQDPLSLAAVGCLIVMLLQWLNGGQYAVAVLPWLVLGWLDRPARASEAAS
jgi:hypothetical protein